MPRLGSIERGRGIESSIRPTLPARHPILTQAPSGSTPSRRFRWARLGDYEVIEPLGEGGMGFVLRALDTRLGRQVALKLLPERVIGDADWLARFEREARVLASLNHPNVATLYGFEEATAVPASADGRRGHHAPALPGDGGGRGRDARRAH